MSLRGPTASAIRAANRNAVGGGKKRCTKGKPCSATCIAANEDCLVGLAEPISQSTTKVVAMIQRRKGGGAAPAAATTQPTLQELSARITQAGKEYVDASGTPQAAAKKAAFEKAKADYAKAKEAAAAKATPASSSQADEMKSYLPGNYKSTRGLTADQDDKVERATNSVDRRINSTLESRQYYDSKTNAINRAQNERIVAPFQKLNNDEKASIALYGQDGVQYYRMVNQLLRRGQMEDSTPEKVNMAQFISKNLQAGLEKMPAAQPQELQRAVSGRSASGLGTLKVGDVIEDKGFGSYTDKGSPVLNQFVKSDRENAIIRVLKPKTSRYVAPVMEYDTEGEHLSMPNTKYRLVSVEPEGFYSRRTNGYLPQYTFEEVIE